MYYIGDIINDNNRTVYGVIDSTDNIEEFYSEKSLLNIVKLGIQIEGVSDLGIVSVKGRLAMKHKLAGLEYEEPIRLDYNYWLFDNDTCYMLMLDEDVVLNNISLDRLQYLISKGVKIDNVVNCGKFCDAYRGVFYIFNNTLNYLSFMISNLVDGISRVLIKAHDLGILNNDIIIKQLRVIRNAWYNYVYDVFILYCDFTYIEVKYSLDTEYTYFRMGDITLSKDEMLKDTLYNELGVNMVKSVIITKRKPTKYCGNINCVIFNVWL